MNKYLDPGHQDQWQLRSHPNGACIFFDGQGCQIYPVRPLQCRTYPFWPEHLKSAYRWKMVARQCPGVNRGRLYSAEEIVQMANQMKKCSMPEE
ncbi:MAG: YkgJ family cysteine cluster protein [Calditrichaeota bacterium]|nr:YkgJ family cysteine cluster protein [Calditrichota bacterium]